MFSHEQFKGHTMGGHVTGIYATRNVLIVIGKHEGKRLLGRVRHSLTDNITWTSKFKCEFVD
jgi:hypothetical protein